MDFVHDTLSNRRTVRVLTVLDVYSRECVALEVGVGFRGEDVGRVLSAAAEERGSLPSSEATESRRRFEMWSPTMALSLLVFGTRVEWRTTDPRWR